MSQKRFKPRPGQVDFTHVRWAPVINCVLKYKGKILIVQRNKNLRLHPGYWSGISGFLDDKKSLKEKIHEELREELSMNKKQISSFKLGHIFIQEDLKLKKTWIVHPVLVTVNSDEISLDWEAQKFAWINPKEIKEYRTVPSFDKVLKALAL